MLVESWKFRNKQQCLVKLHCPKQQGNLPHCWWKTKHARTVEADESMRIRMEGAPRRCHEDHIAGKCMNSWSHDMPQALKIPDARAAVEKELDKLENLPAWQLTKVRNINEVITEARNEGRTVHFASFMDLCHLKKSELEPQFQKQRSSRTPRWHCERWSRIVCSIYWTRIISISNDSSTSRGYHLQTARVRRTSSGRSVCLYPGKNGRYSQIMDNFKIGMSKHLDSSTTTLMAKIIVHYGRFQSFFLSEICTVTLWQDYFGKGNLRKFN